MCRDCVSHGQVDDVIIPPVGPHTHTVILLHGLYCRADDFEKIPAHMKALFGEDLPEASGIKYILPNAPVRTITWGQLPEDHEEGVPAWYDYFTCKCGEMEDDEIDMNQWHDLSDKIHLCIEEEVQELGDPSKVIIGGNSQGGTVACNVALTSKYTLGGLFILRSCLLSYTDVKEDWKSTPVYIFTAELDDTFIAALTSQRFSKLKEAGFNVVQWVEKDLRHEDDSKCELLYTCKWIAEVFFNKKVEVTEVDRPEGPSPEDEDDSEQED